MLRPACLESGWRRLDLRIVGVVGLLLIAGCAQPGRQALAPVGPPPELTAQIDPEPPLTQALDNMDRVALVAPDLRRVVIEGLRRVAAATPGLSVEVADDEIVMRLPDRPDRRFPASPQSAAEWARRAADMLRFAGAVDGTESRVVSKRLIVTFLAGSLVGLRDPGAGLEISGLPALPPAVAPGLILSRLDDRRLRLCAVRIPIDLAGTGIAIGAELAEIDGVALDEQGNLFGPIDSSVTVTFVDDAGTRRTAEFRRGYLDEGEFRRIGPSRDIVYVRPPRFGASSAERAFTQMLHQINAAGPPARAIVLDLRCHPGGLLLQAVAFVDGFLERGSAIAATEGRYRDAAQTFVANRRTGRVLTTPIVVLANGATGSAAELIVAALSEHGRAIVIGSTTAGTASISTWLPIKDIGSLGLTWATLLTAKRQPFERKGLAPDLCLDTDEAAGDPVSLRKPTCRRWIARDGAELAYAERLIGDPQGPPVLSLRASAR